MPVSRRSRRSSKRSSKRRYSKKRVSKKSKKRVSRRRKSRRSARKVHITRSKLAKMSPKQKAAFKKMLKARWHHYYKL